MMKKKLPVHLFRKLQGNNDGKKIFLPFFIKTLMDHFGTWEEKNDRKTKQFSTILPAFGTLRGKTRPKCTSTYTFFNQPWPFRNLGVVKTRRKKNTSKCTIIVNLEPFRKLEKDKTDENYTTISASITRSNASRYEKGIIGVGALHVEAQYSGGSPSAGCPLL